MESRHGAVWARRDELTDLLGEEVEGPLHDMRISGVHYFLKRRSFERLRKSAAEFALKRGCDIVVEKKVYVENSVAKGIFEFYRFTF
jgi:hypothetical protein